MLNADAAEPMVRCGRIARTRTHIHERAGRAASGLAALGAGPGARIVLVMRNDLAFLRDPPFTVTAGRIAHHTAVWDRMGMATQLGWLD